jgi:hypothetical protein
VDPEDAGGSANSLKRAAALIDAACSSDPRPARDLLAAELIAHGAPTTFPDGGSAIGSALHGSQNCQHPEGGPTMQIVSEIPRERYRRTIEVLLDAGAPIPETLWDGVQVADLFAELGVSRR